MSREKHILVGKTITEVLLAADRKALLFKTTEGDVEASCDADCCSFTWIEGVELPALGLPAVVLAVEDLNLPDREGEPTQHESMKDSMQDSHAYYGCKITTDRGELLVDYRNSSNGYYGGNLSWGGDYYYGGVYGQAVSKKEWVALEAN